MESSGWSPAGPGVGLGLPNSRGVSLGSFGVRGMGPFPTLGPQGAYSYRPLAESLPTPRTRPAGRGIRQDRRKCPEAQADLFCLQSQHLRPLARMGLGTGKALDSDAWCPGGKHRVRERAGVAARSHLCAAGTLAGHLGS